MNRLNRLFSARAGDRAIVQVQGSVRLDPYSEPQPDLVLWRPRDDLYGSALAGPADILLAIEVAQSSLDYDRGVKADLYDAVVTRFTDPADGRYRRVAAVPPDEPFAPALLAGCIVTTRDILG